VRISPIEPADLTATPCDAAHRMSEVPGARALRVLYVNSLVPAAGGKVGSRPNASNLGGVAKATLVIRSLLAAGHEVRVLTGGSPPPDTGCRGRAVPVEVPEGTATFYFLGSNQRQPFRVVGNWSRGFLCGRSLVRQFAPDVILTYNVPVFEAVSVLGALTAGKTPLVVQVEDVPLSRRGGLLNISGLLEYISWKAATSVATGYTVVNDRILALLPDNLPVVLMPGIVSPDLERTSGVRRPPFSNAECQVGYFGALNTSKGADRILDLIPDLPTGWRFIVSGAGSLRREFEDQARRHPDKLSFLGYLDAASLYEAMCHCDCLLIPPEKLQENSQGVFPFKFSEYIVAAALVISGHQCVNVTQRQEVFCAWDGTKAHFLETLREARDLERTTRADRLSMRKRILESYSVGAIGECLSGLLTNARRIYRAKGNV
jgi:glycosyltransferase involved in cell wall biosynthesis